MAHNMSDSGPNFKDQCSGHPEDDENPIVAAKCPTSTSDTATQTPTPVAVLIEQDQLVAVMPMEEQAPAEQKEGEHPRAPCCNRVSWKAICLIGAIALMVLAGASVAAVLVPSTSSTDDDGSSPTRPNETNDDGSSSKQPNRTSDDENTDIANNRVVLVGEPIVNFPIVIPYANVQAPTQLPFQVQGEFLANPDAPIHTGIVDHEMNCQTHATCEGFKIYLGSEDDLRIIVAQVSSFYTSAGSKQTGLKDGSWHKFVCTVSEDLISVQVDGIDGIPMGTSDERAVQNPKKFGRVIHSGPYLIGDDPGQFNDRRFKGQLRDIVIVN